jgi:hypothetical protein
MGKRVIGRRIAHEWTDCICVTECSVHSKEDRGNVKVKKFLGWMNHELLFASPCTIVNKVNFQKGDEQKDNHEFEILES